ncbi:MAG: RCC1 repeat-containing protein, partial [Planctomycetota bacterium]|nr:RCC1 repeat-containing protein [Planctomycetota bacterium]
MPFAVTLTGITAVACGANHTLGLRNDGTVFAWGSNGYGQLGIGNTTTQYVPTQTGLANIISIATGLNHSLALRNDGTVWSWGAGIYGQLGDGTNTTSQTTPVQVIGIDNVVAIAAVDNTSFAVLNDGTVRAWGQNAYSQLQLPSTGINSYQRPFTVTLTGITAVACGNEHTLAVGSGGTVFAWGYNTYGELGDGDNSTKYTPVQTVGLSNITAVAAGYNHSLALKNDGTVHSWGRNNYGQLGQGGTTDSNVPLLVPGITTAVAIAACAYSSYALLSDGSVLAWGYNNYGQLGLPSTGVICYQRPFTVTGVSNIRSVSAGWDHSLAAQYNNGFWVWGYNNNGQLGLGDTTQRNTPVQVISLSAYSNSGTYLSVLIQPAAIGSWGVITFTRTILGDTTFSVDVLSEGGSPLLTNVSSGDSLGSINATTYPRIRLRANLGTSNTAVTPTLSDWSVTYAE